MSRPKLKPRFKIDENLPLDVIPLLAESGFETFSVFEENLQGQDDSAIIASCKAEGLTLLTCDLDFADIRAYPPPQHNGILVLRPRRQGRTSILRLIAAMVPKLKSLTLAGHLLIVNDRGIRIHEDVS